MNLETRRRIRADHPSLAGHFPGNPIVPGVLLLDEVLAALTEWREDIHVAAIRSVKFLAPVKPEQPFTISISGQDGSYEVDFRIRMEHRLIVEGRLQLHGRPS
jgi:3-hydroxyacyl-[acyl-carrier-protein] dehydratase